MKDDKELTRVQCGQCAWMSEPHESVAEAYLEVGAHFVNVHRYAATAAPVAAAPPTVVPAREAALAVVHEHSWHWYNCMHPIGGHAKVCRDLTDAVTALLERDRASRSPRTAGVPRDDWGAAWCGGEEYPTVPNMVWIYSGQRYGVTRYWCSDGCRGAWRPLHALRGEGPSPAREGKVQASESLGPPTADSCRNCGRPFDAVDRDVKPQNAPLSGLDAATVEACARIVDEHPVNHGTSVDAVSAAARIRALSTPPGQTKP